MEAVCGESRPLFPCLPELLLTPAEAEPEPERDEGGVDVRTADTSEAAAAEVVVDLAPDSLLDDDTPELVVVLLHDEESVTEPIAGACVCDCDCERDRFTEAAAPSREVAPSRLPAVDVVVVVVEEFDVVAAAVLL